jgi:hypothetical protein
MLYIMTLFVLYREELWLGSALLDPLQTTTWVLTPKKNQSRSHGGRPYFMYIVWSFLWFPMQYPQIAKFNDIPCGDPRDLSYTEMLCVLVTLATSDTGVTSPRLEHHRQAGRK